MSDPGPVSSQGSPLPRQSSPSPRSRHPWRRLAAGLVLLTLLAAVLVSIRPTLRLLHRWQASNILAQAEELIRQQRLSEAIERLGVALRLDPASPATLRTLATIYSRFDLPDAFPIWRALFLSPGHTDADRHACIDLALRLNRFDVAEPELARLLALPHPSPATHAQAADLYLRQGQIDRAIAFAERAHADAPDDPDHALRLARLRLQSASGPQQHAGADLLRPLLAPDSPVRLQALRILADETVRPSPAAHSLIEHLPAPSQAPPAEAVLNADVRLRLEPGSRPELVAALLDQLQGAAPPDQVILGAWLNRAGASRDLLDALSPSHLAAHPTLAPIHLEALARTRQWSALQEALDRPVPIDPWQRNALRALAATGLQQPDLSRESWRRALAEARDHPSSLVALGDWALRFGAPEPAIEAFDLLTRDRLTRLLGYRRLAAVHERTGDTRRLRVLMREWAAHFPDDPWPENAFCYLNALLRRDIEVSREKARSLVDRFPDRLPYRATLALLELRRDDPRAAALLFERFPIPDDLILSPQSRLVYAAVLQAIGRTEEARQRLRNLDPDPLLPEERELLHRILRNGPTAAPAP
ncbi:MAG: tetratricopeptide repeat protein [Verrucomicrobiae bacterium]|nr:tetratricopeptide repeat protein [Verrucomicrobiae bacterium]